MSSINQVIISGNLGQDAELRTTANNTNVCTFSVAVNESRKNKEGNWEETTNWVSCVVFGKRATNKLQSVLTKGTKVTVAGKLRVSTYEKDGVKKTSTSVVADNIDIYKKDNDATNSQNEIPYADEISF